MPRGIPGSGTRTKRTMNRKATKKVGTAKAKRPLAKKNVGLKKNITRTTKRKARGTTTNVVE